MVTLESIMKLLHLRHFIAVYEEGSFSAAAKRVGATQSGLSMHVRWLEDRYGVELLERSSTGVVPTEAGRRFYDVALKAMRSAMHAENTLRELSGDVTGHIRIGLMPTFTRAILSPTLIRYSEQFPNVRVSITEAYSGQLSRQVIDGDLDFAVVPYSATNDSLTVTTMATDREYLVWSADSAFNPGRIVHLKNLSIPKLVLPSRSNARRIMIDSYLSAHGIDVGNILELDAMFGTLDLVANSDWVTILPGILCMPDLEEGRRNIALIDDPDLPVQYLRIEHSAKPLNFAAQAFYDILLDVLERAIEKSTAPHRTARRKSGAA